MLFISHSTLDKEHALDLQRRLRDRGYVCEQHFLDSDQRSGIKLGEKWERVIYDNLRDCQALLVLCSPNWLQSKWCFAELASAKMTGKQVFPLVLADCDRSSLSEYQAVFINSPDDTKREEAYARLFQDLEARGLGPRDWLPWPNPELKDNNGQIDDCPFPGLPAYDERYAAVYFGRETEKQKLLEELRQMRTNGEPRFLMIVGGSGCGKSSLLMAGLLPTLKHSTFHNEWLVLSTLRFDRRTSPNAVFESLADDIVSRYPVNDIPRRQVPDRSTLLKNITQEDEVKAAQEFTNALRHLVIARSTNGATVLLPIDQFEQFLITSSGAHAATFLKFLHQLCQHRDDRLLVLGTLRSDYLDVYERHPQGLKAPGFKEWRLEPFDRKQLARIILEPAARAHVEVAPELTEQLKLDTPTVDALPLLSFTLEKLYRKYARDKRLTPTDYNDLGRMDGSIKGTAEQLFDPQTQPTAVIAAVRMSFVKHLAEVNDKGDFVRLSARWDDLDPLARPILEQFIDQRLLVKTERDGVIFLEVAHEAIFRCWPMLNGWLKGSADVLRWRRDIRRDQESAKLSGRVWKGLSRVQFAVAKKWPTTRRAQLTVEETKWIQATSRRNVLAWTGIGFVAALILASAGIAWWQRGVAESARTQAKHSLARGRIELADSARTRGDFTDTSFYYWNALEGMETSDPLNESVRGLLASWMRRTGRPFLYDWQPRTGISRDPDVFPMEDRFQSRLFPVAFSPSGSEVLTVSQDRTVRLWNSSTGQLRIETGVHDSRIRDIVFSSGGGAFAVHCSDNTIWTWQASSAKLIGKLSHDEGPIAAFTCNSDGTKVLLGCSNGYARLWDVPSNQPCTPKLSHNLSVNSVTISPDNHVLVTSGAGVKAWNIRGTLLWAADGLTEVIQVGPDSKVLLMFGERPPNQYVRQIDVATGKDLDPRRIDARLGEEVYNGECSCLVASLDGSRIACGGFDRVANRGYVMVWNARTGEPIGAPLPHAGTVRRIEFARDGKSLISATVGGDVRWWDLSAGTPLSQTVRQKKQSSPPVISRNGRFFLIRTGEKTAEVCDTLSGKAIGKELITNSPCQPLACASDGKVALLGDWGLNAQLWDIATGKPVGDSLSHSSRISSAVFSRSCSDLATSTEDGTLQIWDGATGTRLGIAISAGDLVKSLDISSTSKVLIVGCANGEITLWNYESRKLLSRGTKHSGKVNSVALAEDGRLAISCGEDRTVRIWDSSATQIGEPLSHDAEVLSVALSADGRLALAGTENGTARLWDVPTGKVRGELFRHWERPPSKNPIVSVSIVDNDQAITGEAYGVFRVWEIYRMGSASSTELRDRIELVTGWHIGADEARLRLTPDQWQERMRVQNDRSAIGEQGIER